MITVKNAIIIYLIIVCAVFYLETNSLNAHFITLIITSLLGIYYFKGDVLYPFTWYTPIVILYNVSIYILELSGLRVAEHFDIVMNSLYASVISFFFYCLMFIKPLPKYINYFNISNYNGQKILKITFIISIYIMMCIPIFFMLGYSSKMEMNLNGGIPGLGIFSNLFLIFYLCCVTFEIAKYKKIPKKIVCYALALSLSISLIIGERELFLTIILGLFLIYYFYFKISWKKILIFAVLGVFIVSYLGDTRQITNRGGGSNQKSLEESLFGGEFVTSGRNFNTLLNNRGDWDYQYGMALIYDISHSIVPSFIINVQNTTGWFNEKYNTRRDQGFGAGFSFLAEGYLQCGYLGVVIWTILLGIIVRKIYYNSNKSIFGLSIYIFMITDIMYAIRGDFSYILSPLIKQVLVCYILLKFAKFKTNKV